MQPLGHPGRRDAEEVGVCVREPMTTYFEIECCTRSSLLEEVIEHSLCLSSNDRSGDPTRAAQYVCS